MKVTILSRLAGGGVLHTSSTAGPIQVPPLPLRVSMYFRAFSRYSEEFFLGSENSMFAVLPKSMTLNVSSGFMWSRTYFMVSCAFSKGMPL